MRSGTTLRKYLNALSHCMQPLQLSLQMQEVRSCVLPRCSSRNKNRCRQLKSSISRFNRILSGRKKTRRPITTSTVRINLGWEASQRYSACNASKTSSSLLWSFALQEAMKTANSCITRSLWCVCVEERMAFAWMWSMPTMMTEAFFGSSLNSWMEQ